MTFNKRFDITLLEINNAYSKTQGKIIGISVKKEKQHDLTLNGIVKYSDFEDYYLEFFNGWFYISDKWGNSFKVCKKQDKAFSIFKRLQYFDFNNDIDKIEYHSLMIQNNKNKAYIRLHKKLFLEV